MVQTRSEKRAVFKLDVRSQKDQGIFKNTSNSLTGGSASSAGAIHYATTLPPSNPMPMARPRAHGSMKVGRKSKYAPGVFKAHLRSVALGRTKRGGGRATRNTMCATTSTSQGPPCAKRQHTAQDHTTSDEACGLPALLQRNVESLQGCHLFKWHKGTGNVYFQPTRAEGASEEEDRRARCHESHAAH